MNYVKVEDAYPIEYVDVFVVTSTGKKGVARYWHLTGRWLSSEKCLVAGDIVIKWKYADAVQK